MDSETALTPAGFTELQQEHFESRVKVYPARSFNPSSLGHPCTRYLTWRFTKWQQQKRYSWTLQSIFDMGNELEPAIRHRLEALSFTITEIDRPTEYLVHGAKLSGRLDGKITAWKGTKYPMPLVLEGKTMAPYSWDSINSIKDIQEHRRHYIRSYFVQGQCYLFLENLPRGLFALYNKTTGLLKLIPFELDYSFTESILARIEEIHPMVLSGEDPPPIPYDEDICGQCAFSHLCYPPRDYGAGTQLIEDGELLEMLEERATVADKRARYEELDKAIKGKAKQALGKDGMGMCGPWEVSTKTSPRKAYEVKASEATTVTLRRIE